MKDINYVIQEVVRRTGLPEDQVAEAIRSAATDCREFMNGKLGYSLYFPRLGTFIYRVTAIKDYIIRQRKYMAYWMIRLKIGVDKNNERTIEAAENNIDTFRQKIKATLTIKNEFLNDHSTYYPFKAKILRMDTASDLGRLDELYNVDEFIRILEKRYQGKEEDMQQLPDVGRISSKGKKDNPGKAS